MVEVSAPYSNSNLTYAVLVPATPAPVLPYPRVVVAAQSQTPALVVHAAPVLSVQTNSNPNVDVGPLLQGLVPHRNHNANNASSNGNPESLQMQGPQQMLQIQNPVSGPDAPLDLSCPKSKAGPGVSEQKDRLCDLPPMTIPRSGSCSSTTSFSSLSSVTSLASCGSCSSLTDEERRQKRKDQNKAAAQNYRQRKKSFSGLIETEHEQLTKKNLQLKNQKMKLDEQIRRVRALLNEAIEVSKKEEQASDDTVSEPPTSCLATRTAQFETPLTPSSQPSQTGACSTLILDGEDVGFGPMRPRKYSWPMTLSSKERKKEQNKLASRRFRQKRKQEQNVSEREVLGLEANNKKLRDRCEELESKIRLLKEMMNKSKSTSNKGQAILEATNN